MQLTERDIKLLKKEAEQIGSYGKISLIAFGDNIDLVIEKRIRMVHGKETVKLVNGLQRGKEYGY
jgi:hypothetical protein